MRRLVVIAAASVLLTGCTSSSDSSDGAPQTEATATPTTGGSTTGGSTAGSGSPSCADIWKAGATLPADYESCVTDGAPGPQDVTPCEDGTKLVAYLDTYYAVTGRTIAHPDISPMQDTDEFLDLYAECTGI